MKEKYGFTEVWLHDRIVVSGKTLENLLARQAAVNSHHVRETDFCLEVDILLNGQKKRYAGAYDGDGVFVSSAGIPMTDDAVFEKDWRYVYNLFYEMKYKDKWLDKDGYIWNQNDELFADMYYGAWNIQKNGCELIAIYNTLNRFDIKVNLADIINEYEENGGLWLGGYFGTKSSFIPKYFENFACLTVAAVFDSSSVSYALEECITILENALTEDNVLIMSSFKEHGFQIHTYMGFRKAGRIKI